MLSTETSAQSHGLDHRLRPPRRLPLKRRPTSGHSSPVSYGSAWTSMCCSTPVSIAVADGGGTSNDRHGGCTSGPTRSPAPRAPPTCHRGPSTSNWRTGRLRSGRGSTASRTTETRSHRDGHRPAGADLEHRSAQGQAAAERDNGPRRVPFAGVLPWSPARSPSAAWVNDVAVARVLEPFSQATSPHARLDVRAC